EFLDRIHTQVSAELGAGAGIVLVHDADTVNAIVILGRAASVHSHHPSAPATTARFTGFYGTHAARELREIRPASTVQRQIFPGRLIDRAAHFRGRELH